MLDTIVISNAIQTAGVISKQLPSVVPTTAQVLYQALIAVAIEAAKHRKYSLGVTHVSFHLPLEVLSHVCGVHRVTAWRNLKVLKELGVVDYRPAKSTLRGESRNSGCIFEVRLNPSAGTRCRLSYGDLKHQWRDLQKDVYAKRTAYRQLQDRVQQSEENSKELDIKALLGWVIPETYINPGTSDSCTSRQASLYTLLDIKTAPKEEVNQMVNLAAEALSQALRDASSLNWYRLLLWQVLRRYRASHSAEDYFYQVYLCASRAKVDTEENFAKRPGALFHSRLQKFDWFQSVMNGPSTRVGLPPKKA